MKEIGRQYLTLQGIETIDEAVKVMKQLASKLEQLQRDDTIESYLISTLYDKETILDYFLEPEEVLIFSGGKLPVVHVNVTCRLDRGFEEYLQKLEEEFELKLMQSFSIGN